MGATHRGKQRKAEVGNGIAELSQLGHGSVSPGSLSSVTAAASLAESFPHQPPH